MPTHTGAEATQLILRWFHIIAGITWVGLLYFFNLINVPFMKQVDATMKAKDFSVPDPARPELVPLERAGHGLLRILVLGTVLRRARRPTPGRRSAGATIGFFLLLWIAVWFILFMVIKKDDAQRICPGRHHRHPLHRRSLAVRELHARWARTTTTYSRSA